MVFGDMQSILLQKRVVMNTKYLIWIMDDRDKEYPSCVPAQDNVVCSQISAPANGGVYTILASLEYIII